MDENCPSDFLTRENVEKHRQHLLDLINQWNESRLDLFRITSPDENLEFYGVIRFFFREPNKKYATKCIKVSSSHTCGDVVDLLLNKLFVDKSSYTYALWEVNENGAKRLVPMDVHPLSIQLYWQDDSKMRFELKASNSEKNKKDNSFNSEKKKNGCLKNFGSSILNRSPLLNRSKKNLSRAISNPETVSSKNRKKKLDEESCVSQRLKIVRVVIQRSPTEYVGLSIVEMITKEKPSQIYVKKIIEQTAAHINGQIEIGDQILSVNGKKFLGITQDVAAEIISTAGTTIFFEILKHGAYLNGFGQYFSNKTEPSPTTSMASTLPASEFEKSHTLQQTRNAFGSKGSMITCCNKTIFENNPMSSQSSVQQFSLATMHNHKMPTPSRRSISNYNTSMMAEFGPPNIPFYHPVSNVYAEDSKSEHFLRSSRKISNQPYNPGNQHRPDQKLKQQKLENRLTVTCLGFVGDETIENSLNNNDVSNSSNYAAVIQACHRKSAEASSDGGLDYLNLPSIPGSVSPFRPIKNPSDDNNRGIRGSVAESSNNSSEINSSHEMPNCYNHPISRGNCVPSRKHRVPSNFHELASESDNIPHDSYIPHQYSSNFISGNNASNYLRRCSLDHQIVRCSGDSTSNIYSTTLLPYSHQHRHQPPPVPSKPNRSNLSAASLYQSSPKRSDILYNAFDNVLIEKNGFEPRTQILGTNEVYANDPRQKYLREFNISQKNLKSTVDGSNLGFREKMHLFASNLNNSSSV